VYVRERNAITDKFGAYFLSDPRGERLLAEIETYIIDRLRIVYTPAGYDELGQILSQQQTLPDLEIELGINYKVSESFEKFRKWIKDNKPESGIDEFVRDLTLYSGIIKYETLKMFNDWYQRKEGINQGLDELLEQIIPELRWDSRYTSISRDYLNNL
jgi:hypothetical protein